MPTTRSQTLGGRRRRVAASTAATKKQQKQRKKRIAEQREPPSTDSIVINRAPVLTLWAAVVAEREEGGHTFEEGLTFGRWVSVC